MKKYLSSLCLLCGLILSPIPTANAVTEGCPDTWKIDTTSRAGFEELQQAKGRLGSDLALSQPIIQYQDYSGELGPISAPKDKAELGLQDVYLYGKTKVQWRIDVQVKNCQTKSSFLINVGTLAENLNYKNVITNVDPETWASANEQSFIDFTKASQFGSCVKSLQSGISPPNLGAQMEGGRLVIGALGAILRQRTFSDPCGVFRINPQRFFTYQDLTPECRYYSEQSDRTTAIREGSSCDIALSLPTRDGLIVFTKFTLKANDYKVVVVCSKGKLQKNYTTYRGYEFRVKCPAGYKKSQV